MTTRFGLLLGASLALLGCSSAPAKPAAPAPSTGACPEMGSGPETINRFYEAFGRRDYAGMACCYAPDIEFTDSIFGTLKGKRALAMWSMLTGQAKELSIQHANVVVDGAQGHAHWDASYAFPFLLLDNHVDNHVDASFELKAGKIARHRDEFDLRRWMKQAMWPLGGVISEATIREGVQTKLDEYIAQHPEFQEPKASLEKP